MLQLSPGLLFMHLSLDKISCERGGSGQYCHQGRGCGARTEENRIHRGQTHSKDTQCWEWSSCCLQTSFLSVAISLSLSSPSSHPQPWRVKREFIGPGQQKSGQLWGLTGVTVLCTGSECSKGCSSLRKWVIRKKETANQLSSNEGMFSYYSWILTKEDAGIIFKNSYKYFKFYASILLW